MSNNNPLINKVRKPQQEEVRASELLEIKRILTDPRSSNIQKAKAMERFYLIQSLVAGGKK